MTKRLETALLAGVLLLGGCDRAQRERWARDRNDSRYRQAMASKEADNFSEAEKGFAAVLANDPANASARLQLAELQEKRHDYMGAVCNLHEFLLQRPDSDKVAMVRDRLVFCERELAKDLAVKTGVTNVKTLSEELQRKNVELSECEKRLAAAKKDLDEAQRKIDQLNGENGRVRKLLAGMNEETGRSRLGSDAFVTAKQVLDEEDGGANVRLDADVKELLAEQDAMLASDGREAASALLPEQPADAKAVREARQAAEAKAARANAPKEPPHERRPAHYVVQEGDTLYKIALRFYGRITAWREIREANKATVSTDGRVKAGQRLALPNPEIQEAR